MAILDVYDDPDRTILRSKVADAHLLERFIDPIEKLARYPDHLFALVLQDGTKSIRKFACVSKPQTAISAAYFTETWKNLPVEAVKVAATNLCTACDWYGLRPPEELKKLANWNPLGLRYELLEKAASAGKTHPWIRPRIDKIAAAFVGEPPEWKEPDLGDPGPLDSPELVKSADLRFRRNRGLMDRRQKVAYCRELVKKASAFGVPVSNEILRWGSTKIASPSQILSRIEKRASVIKDNLARRHDLDALRVKLAAVGELPGSDVEIGDLMVEKIAETDAQFGVDRAVVEDPHFVVYDPMPKRAKYEWRSKNGRMIVDDEKLASLASDPSVITKLARVFDTSLAAQFGHDPVGTFSSLPDLMKKAVLNVLGA